jgi:hypothetical protein
LDPRDLIGWGWKCRHIALWGKIWGKKTEFSVCPKSYIVYAGVLCGFLEQPDILSAPIIDMAP